MINIEDILKESNSRDKYSLAIDYIANYLIKEKKFNHCDFHDGRCIANRLSKCEHTNNGCCYKYKYG